MEDVFRFQHGPVRDLAQQRSIDEDLFQPAGHRGVRHLPSPEQIWPADPIDGAAILRALPVLTDIGPANLGAGFSHDVDPGVRPALLVYPEALPVHALCHQYGLARLDQVHRLLDRGKSGGACSSVVGVVAGGADEAGYFPLVDPAVKDRSGPFESPAFVSPDPPRALRRFRERGAFPHTTRAERDDGNRQHETPDRLDHGKCPPDGFFFLGAAPPRHQMSGFRFHELQAVQRQRLPCS